MMRTMAVWIGAVLVAGGLWSASIVSQGLADEPAAPRSATEGAAGKETGGAETVLPVVEGEPAPPPEAADVQERGVPLKLPPSATAPAPPSGTAPLPCGAGLPTQNIAKVACAIKVATRSVTTEVVVIPGLALTRPVTISVALGGYGPKRITQQYSASTGNRFLYDDPEGDGNPRPARVDVTLEEPNPRGGIYTFTIPGSVILDPLYNVAVGPLKFTLKDYCNIIGSRAMGLVWSYPDRSFGDARFDASKNEPIIFKEFVWSRNDVSASANLIRPYFDFWNRGDINLLPSWLFEFKHGALSPTPPPNLVPGSSSKISIRLTDKYGADCHADVEYFITYTLVKCGRCVRLK